MRPRLPFRQFAAIGRAEAIARDALRHLRRLRHFDAYHRRFAIGGETVDDAFIARLQATLIFLSRHHRLIGFDPRLTVHREGIGPGMRREAGGIDGQRLVLIFQVEVLLQAARVHRLFRRAVGAVRLQLDIPPPFLDRVQPAIADGVVQARQQRRGGGDVHRRPAEGFLGEDPFQIPRAGLHAAPAHGAAFSSDPVGRAFLAIGFPYLIAVEHQFRPGGDGAGGAFAGAFVAGFAEPLEAEIDGPVMGERHVRRHHT